MANKYEYEGSKQRIVPLTISQFVAVLKALLDIKRRGKSFSHKTLLALYNATLEPLSLVGASDEWLAQINGEIDNWIAKLY
jgi:hypothetical protein